VKFALTLIAVLALSSLALAAECTFTFQKQPPPNVGYNYYCVNFQGVQNGGCSSDKNGNPVEEGNCQTVGVDTPPAGTTTHAALECTCVPTILPQD
jgi:hypothetical protein